MLKVVELFAGIGAQAQALKEANIEHEIVAISEIDKYALKVYEALHGKPNNLGNIKEIEVLPTADLWTYSFPCTDISLAGQMKGFDRDSETGSSLLWEVERLINNAAINGRLPKYLLMENVKNLVSKRFIGLFNEWKSFLESHGYRNYYQVLNAKDYGIPQNRERVFMVSSLDSKNYIFPTKIKLENKLNDYLEKDVSEKYFLSERLIRNLSDTNDRNGFIRGNRFRLHDEKSEYAYTISTCPGSRATDNFIMVPQKTKQGYALAHVGDGIYTNRTHQKRGVVQKNMIPTLKTSPNDIGVVVDKDDLISIRRLTPRECWRLMGWNDNCIDVVLSSGTSDTQLYKMAGNSIVISCLQNLLIMLIRI